MTLVLVALAAFALWEWLLLLPVQVATWLQPALVVALASGLSLVPDRALLPLAAAGAVGLLHSLVRHEPADPVMLRRGVGRRIPNLP